MSLRPVSEYEQRAKGETELLMAREIAHADGDCRVALLLLARRFDALLGINEQLTDKLGAACTALNLISEQLPAPPIPLTAAPYQHTTSERCAKCGQAPITRLWAGLCASCSRRAEAAYDDARAEEEYERYDQARAQRSLKEYQG